MTAEHFVARLVRFGRTLREGGLEVGPGRLQDAMVALTAVDPTERDDVYWALRCTLCSHCDHLEVFDQAFGAFWAGRRDGGERSPRLDVDPVADDDARQDESGLTALTVETVSEDDQAEGDSEQGLGSSATERLMTLDFREYGTQELREARALISRIALSLPRRRSFRREPSSAGRHLDMRRTLRDAMDTGGHPVRRAWRRNRIVPRRTVFLMDVSASMAPYVRAMVIFAQAAVQAGRTVEAFTFGTRLTRLTLHLAGRDRDRALAAAAEAVPDWAGGTRIGASLKAFNDSWGRRGISRGALVIVVSDGWERGDPAPLREEMSRLHRAAHAVVWVNPLAADPRYRPLAAGMAAALPSVDVFVPGHNLADLMALARVLESLPDRRGRVPRMAAA
ncbi:MAG: vWA domain-containing protein [Thermoleophilaceae bacterium]|jgi:uncharacterized protein